MLSYALIFITIAAIGLAVFYLYIAAYERSQISVAVKNYISSIDTEKVKKIAGPVIDSIDPNIQNHDDCCEQICRVLSGCEYAKDIRLSNDNKSVYYLVDDDIIYETVTFSKGPKDMFGFAEWMPTEENVDPDNFVNCTEVKVPSEYSVVVNGYTLGDDHITDKKSHYDLLEGLYEIYPQFPTIYTYTTGNYIGNVDLEICDSSGRQVNLDSITEDYFTDNCTAEEKSHLDEVVGEYIRRYVIYTSGSTGDTASNYYYMIETVEPGSELNHRLSDSIGGFGFASSRGDIIKDITINRYMKLNNGYYVCDTSYTVDTKSGTTKQFTTATYNQKIVVHNDLICSQYTY